MSQPKSLRGKRLVWGERTYIMGIVNVTPDSFSGDGIVDAQAAARRAVMQVKNGCDIVDLGGESTRPGHARLEPQAEAARVIPAVRRTRELVAEAIISVDTYKPDVARAACDAGADIINSVWGMPDDLLEVALEFDAPVAIMHNNETTNYAGGVVDAVLAFLDEAAQRCVRRGMPKESIVLDPGIGFGKTADQNIAVLQALPRLVALGFPTLVGTSRKSTIGKLTGKEPAERIFGTAATTALAIAAGIDIVRVHDVAEARDVVAVSDAIVRDWRPENWIG